MKTIPNVQFTIKAEHADTHGHTAATLLKLTLSQAPAAGFDFATMRVRNRIADVLDKTKRGKAIELEDADFAAARQCVEAFRWAGAHPDLLKFAELFGL